MFERLGSLLVARRRAVLALTALFLAVAALWGTSVFGALTSGFDDPQSEAARATALAERTVGGNPDVVLLYRADVNATVDDRAYRAAVESHLASLPPEDIASTVTTWSGGRPGMVSGDRRETIAVLELAGADRMEREELYESLADRLGAAPPGFTVQRGGVLAANSQITHQIESDIALAEMLSIPIVLLLLLLVFGGLVAASLPLAIGGVAILGAFTVLRILTEVTEVSVFSINIITMLGLGLGIDYALFIVSRFREELSGGAEVHDAVIRTVAMAGRTVAFSGVTVSIALASLMLFPQVFLKSMGFGGVAAVGIATVAALTVLPALLAVLGHRVNALRVPLPWRRRARAAQNNRGEDSAGFWAGLARRVMRRPVAYVVVLVPVLLLLGAPFLGMKPGGVDARVLPAGTEARVVNEVLTDRFAFDATPMQVMATFATPPAASTLEAYRAQLADMPGAVGAAVTGVDGTAGNIVRITVTAADAAVSPEARQLARDVRALAPPDGAAVLVGGESAALVDQLDAMRETVPWMVGVMALTTVVLLFLAFGSVVLSVKALLMNALSLTAAFGAMVWIFQDGNLSGVLGFTATGTLEATQPILVLAIAFGLSMDYEVLLLSRIREEWDRTGDNAAAVATGLQRTGGIITSAALILVVVFGAFATSGISFIKMIGIGMVIAVAVDATVVRALLVPATMALLGRWNWWAPRPLARVYDRFGIRESGELALEAR